MYKSRIALAKWKHNLNGEPIRTRARLRGILSWLCALALLHTGMPLAQADIPIELVAQWGGATNAVLVDGDRAYLGVGPRLAVLDISDPIHPVELGLSDTVMRFPVEHIVKSGDHVYVAAGSLYIIDVSDPTAPTFVGVYWYPDTTAPWSSVAVRGDYAYVGLQFQHQLHVVDISNPRSPQLVHVLPEYLFWPGWLETYGDYLIVKAQWEAVKIFDLSNPGIPRRVAFISEPRLNAVAVSGNYVYLLSDFGVDIYDISNAGDPRLVGHVMMRYGDIGSWIVVRDGYLYAWNNSVLEIADVSDPENPTYIGHFIMSGIHAFGNFDLTGSRLLLPSSHGGLKMIDVSDPTAPVLAGTFDRGGRVWSTDVSDGYAYVTGQEPNLHVFDVSDPSDPRRIAEVYLDEPGGTVTVDGTVAYLHLGRTLHVFSVEDPTAPELWASIEMPDYINDITINGQYVFASMYRGFSVWDVSEPRMPHHIGGVAGVLSPKTLSVSDVIGLSCTLGNRRMQVFDLSDIRNPVAIHDFDPGYPYDSEIVGDLAYVANGPSGLTIFDLSNPVAPSKVAQFDTDRLAMDVELAGQFAYIADQSSGIVIVDVSDPSQAAFAGRHPTLQWATSLHVSGSHVFVACGDGGLVVLRVTIRGDANCDGHINALDVEPFLLALFDPASYSGDYPHCDINNADINGDGQINASDIEPFIELLWGP